LLTYYPYVPKLLFSNVNNYNLTYYCIIGSSLRRTRDLSFFRLLFLVATAVTSLLLGCPWLHPAGEHYPSWIEFMVCMYAWICVYIHLLVSRYRLFPAPTSPTAYILYVKAYITHGYIFIFIHYICPHIHTCMYVHTYIQIILSKPIIYVSIHVTTT